MFRIHPAFFTITHLLYIDLLPKADVGRSLSGLKTRLNRGLKDMRCMGLKLNEKDVIFETFGRKFRGGTWYMTVNNHQPSAPEVFGIAFGKKDGFEPLKAVSLSGQPFGVAVWSSRKLPSFVKGHIRREPLLLYRLVSRRYPKINPDKAF